VALGLRAKGTEFRYHETNSLRGLMEEEINSLSYIGNFAALLNDELDETIAWTDQFEPSAIRRRSMDIPYTHVWRR
jgi:hypothetical protein